MSEHLTLEQVATEITLKELYADLQDIAPKWESVGIQLSILNGELHVIRANVGVVNSIVDYCFREIINDWLCGPKEHVTVAVLANAVQQAGYGALANELLHEESTFKLDTRTVIERLKPCKASYSTIGIHLNISLSSIKTFESFADKSSLCLLRMLHYYLNNKEPSVSELCAALEYVGRRDLSEKIAKKYHGRRFKTMSSSGASEYDSGSVNQGRVHVNEPPSAEENRKAYDDIIKSEKQVLKLLFAKLIFLGPPKRGKTLTRLRLEEVFVNMESDPKYKTNASTPVAKGESYLITDTSRTAAVASESGWRSLKDQSEEMKLLFQLFHKLKQDAGTSFSAEPQSDLPDSSRGAVHQMPPTGESKSHDSGSIMTSFLDVFEKLLASHSWEELSDDLENMCLLYIKDTGGQPELMDLLPSLIIGPALYLLFCRLGEDLDRTYEVSLRGIPNSIPDRESCCTVRENLMSALSCIFSMHSYSARSESEAENALFGQIVEGTPAATAYIVGTFKDKISTDGIVKFDEEMQEVIKDTVFYEEDVVHFVSKDGFESNDPNDKLKDKKRLVYPVDNHYGTTEEIKCFQRFIYKALNKFPRPEIPARWLPFSLFLRFTGKKYVKLDICYECGKELRMSKRDTDVALWFFHHHTGIIMHFPNVSELKNYVITDTQFIYDSLSNLIFEEGVNMSAYCADTLRSVGQISFDHINEISGDMFPPKQMEALLKHLNVIAPLNEPLTGKIRPPKQVYFMPCVLKNSSEEDIKKILKKKKSENDVYSLKIYYECGFVPIGMFSAMIAGLVGKASSKGLYPFVLSDKKNMRKNLITFNYGSDGDTVVFICTVICYEVIIIRRKNFENPTSQVCAEVRKIIESTLQDISEKSGSLFHTVKSKFGRYKFAFDCPDRSPDHPKEGHLCLLECGHADPHIMTCEKEKNVQDLQAKHRVWFGHDCASNPQIKGSKVRNINADSVNIKSPHSSSSRSESDKVSHLPEPVVKPYPKKKFEYFPHADGEKVEVDRSTFKLIFPQWSHGELMRNVQLSFGAVQPQKGEKKQSILGKYDMDKWPHGICLIINNETFTKQPTQEDTNEDQPNLDQRDGTNIDEQNLIQTFRYLGYIVEVHRNCVAIKITEIFEEIRQRDHNNYDSFICCILSHGKSGHVYGSDSVLVRLDDITSQLNGERCQSLSTRPKLFFLQACRGEQEDSGVHPQKDCKSGISEKVHTSSGLRIATNSDVIIPKSANFFFSYATPDNYVSWRHPVDGSWYISELCKSLTSYGTFNSLVDMVTLTNDNVKHVYSYQGFVQSPSFESILGKDVFFF